MNDFNEIRPYRDDEVEGVIKNLLQEKEFFIGLSNLRFPKLTSVFPNIGGALAKRFIKKQLKDVNTVKGIQNIVSDTIDRMIKKSADTMTVSGLENLKTEESYLFMSNHRDIVMDPAIIGYFLFHSNHDTCEIAIGDNLLKKKIIADLMRLNKSFIVKRSAIGREKLMALKLLSAYIHHTLGKGNSIWIAQSEGRAKDGKDLTDPAIVKMLHIGRNQEDKGLSIKEDLDRLKIVPVSISYEYDPCDLMKARELYEIDTKGSFQKHEKSDEESIGAGLKGYKGNIHVSFGDVLNIEEADATHIAKKVDEQIIESYKLFPSNYLAYETLRDENKGIGPSLEDLGIETSSLKNSRPFFNERIDNFPQHLRKYALKMYANPVISRINFQKD